MIMRINTRVLPVLVAATVAIWIVLFLFFKRYRLPGHFIGAPSPQHSAVQLDLDRLGVKWGEFAYVQYATELPYLCNTVVLLAALNDLGCRGDRLVMYSDQWSPDVVAEADHSNDEAAQMARLLRLARDTYHAMLRPVPVVRRDHGDPTWAKSYTKLLAMNQTQYRRVLSLDSDMMVRQCMDELFILPSARVAMSRAYWEWDEKHELTSLLILMESSASEFQRILRSVENAAGPSYDMEIMSRMYSNSALVLPHRQYALLSREFFSANHTPYFGNDGEVWDAQRALDTAKLVHFSDWPTPKPWFLITEADVRHVFPGCPESEYGRGGLCAERDIWVELRQNFVRRRKGICGIEEGGIAAAAQE